MGLSDRLYHLAKSYLDTAKARWDEVDSAAQQELNDAVSSHQLDAWERAQMKISAAQSTNAAQQEFRSLPQDELPISVPIAQPIQQQPVPPLAQTPTSNALSAAYKVLDVPEGSDLATVQRAYQELQKKADPSRFPAGSKDSKLAQDILRRINAAYMVLANSLCAPSDDRFDRLEL